MRINPPRPALVQLQYAAKVASRIGVVIVVIVLAQTYVMLESGAASSAQDVAVRQDAPAAEPTTTEPTTEPTTVPTPVGWHWPAPPTPLSSPRDIGLPPPVRSREAAAPTRPVPASASSRGLPPPVRSRLVAVAAPPPWPADAPR